MPTVVFLSQLKKHAPSDIATRGFHDELWEGLASLKLASVLTWRILSAGPCPNARRVFFQLTSEPTVPSRYADVDELLGERLSCSRRKSGQRFHAWVDSANQAVNKWLEEGHCLSIGDACPERLGCFYQSRLTELEKLLSDLGIERSEAAMAVQHPIRTGGLPFAEPTPDGVWTRVPVTYACGVFEAKLTPPPEPCDIYLLTAYAILLEREGGRPCDYGVFLALTRDNADVCCAAHFLGEAARDAVRQNLEHFLSLLASSRLRGRSVIDDYSRFHPADLVCPELATESAPCTACWYREGCRGQE